MNDSNTKILIAAINYAADKHRDQRRKGKHALPYINHPIKVMHELSRHQIIDSTALTAAVLHDVIEDTDTPINELEALFGLEIANTVAQLSDNKRLSANKRKALQVKNAPELTHKAKLIRIADKTSNLHDIIHYPPEWNVQRKIKYFMWAEQVVLACGKTHQELEKSFWKVYNSGLEYFAEFKKPSGPTGSHPDR